MDPMLSFWSNIYSFLNSNLHKLLFFFYVTFTEYLKSASQYASHWEYKGEDNVLAQMISQTSERYTHIKHVITVQSDFIVSFEVLFDLLVFTVSLILPKSIF